MPTLRYPRPQQAVRAKLPRWRKVLAVLGVLLVLRAASVIAFRQGWIVDPLRRFNKRVTNRLALTPLGRRVYAVVHHVGRRSGHQYLTPVIVEPTNDGFLIPLPYGPHTDWRQNVLAVGGCTLEWHGRAYALTNPTVVTAAEALSAFHQPWRFSLRLYGVKEFLRLRYAPVAEPEQAAA